MCRKNEIEKLSDDIKEIHISDKQLLKSEDMKIIFEQMSRLAENLEKRLKPVFDALPTFEGIAERLRQASFDAKLASYKIVENGWFIAQNSRLGFSEIIALQDLSPEELNMFFEQYYAENDGDNINMIFESLHKYIKESNIDTGLKRLLNECIDAYEKGFYIVSTVALFAVIEGVMYNLFYNIKVDKLEKKKVLKNMKNKIKEKDSILEFSYLSVFTYLDKSFKHAEFSKEEPRIILNRNWLLHGKSEYEITQLDAIKMFSLVESILDFT